METTTLDDEKFCRVLSEAVHEVTGESVPEGFTLDSPLGDLGVDSLTRMEVVTVLEVPFLRAGRLRTAAEGQHRAAPVRRHQDGRPDIGAFRTGDSSTGFL
ncbi:acyl carrier protein [Streptomyces sp. WAC 01420]|uniref:acyl carrier protein n=1 Tax=Streptomyces sp. WAC 01420 TaxID=2203203 RepID=UPI000F8767F6|nr:acyl carrier protein [Streptomyces sp. WAC 01420]RSN00041.1 hypothetical protein DMA10_04655 [Streptomyces sp. WAC 01420]